jgi:flagellar protein FliS
MYDPAAAYRTAQVTTASPAAQIVLLYQGAIRFAHQHIAALTTGNLEEAHRVSLRCQEIVGALRASLDPTAGPVAENLDSLYDFTLQRLIEGNIKKQPKPTEEALQVLQGLLDAWKAIATAAPVAREAAYPQATPSFGQPSMAAVR